MLQAGSQFGNYKIEKLLGQGTMGDVYLAVDEKNERTVALKLLNEEHASSQEYRDKLANEAGITAKIESPYVVKVWDHGEFEKTPYIAMEYIAGPELRDIIDSLEFSEKFEVAKKIAQGIEAAHACGLVHKDLKPENIKLTDDGDPKILDFGIAKTVDTENVDEYGDVEGTLYYLSPEQLSGETVTTQSDIFSLGTIFFELFTGSRPFEGVFAASIIYSILHEEPDSPSDVNSKLPIWFDSLVMKMLAKQTSDRFETVTTIIEFMNACIEETVEVSKEDIVSRKQSVTVVDIKNMSGDENWDYFCEGFTDEVIKELTRRTDLVISAQPSTSNKRDIAETFKLCHSDFVMVGSLMKLGEKIQLSLNIYGDNGDEVIWSEKYLDHADNLFEILSKAANDASEKLSSVTKTEVIKVADLLQTNFSAYDYYLKGKNYYQTNKPDDLKFATQMYTKALEIEENYSLAHAGLSDVYAFEFMAYYDRTDQKIESSKKEAMKAIELNAKSPEAYRSLARYHMFTGSSSKAEECLIKSVDLDPKFAIGYRTLSWLELSKGDYNEATRWAKKSLDLLPTDLETLLLLSLITINQKKFTAAIATLQRAIELGPDYGRAYYYLGQVYLKLGVLEPSLDNFKSAIKFEGDPNCFIDCGYVHLIKKQYQEAEQKFKESITAGYFPFVANYYLGLSHLFQNDFESANLAFEEGLKQTRKFDFSKAENMHILAYQALILAGLKRNDDAMAEIEKIELTGELDGEILNNLARCYSLLGMTEKAEQYKKYSFEAPAGPSEKEAAIDPHFDFSF